MKIVEYKQGMTSVWCDGEKLIIKNPTGKKHVKDNVEQIFGMGEFDKIVEVAYFEDFDRKKFKAPYEAASGYIPERARTDLKSGKGHPGTKEKDYLGMFK